MYCRSAVTLLLATALLGGCAFHPMPAAQLPGLPPTPLLLLGEQHDAPDHQRLQRHILGQLVDHGEAAAVVLEMVEQGRHTTGLPPGASEAEARQTLGWTDELNPGAWPWVVYGPLVMDAVRAGVPVLGGNLQRSRMRAAMTEASLDATLPPRALDLQRENIREGHCGLLPEPQIAPMARIQIARDRAMAQTAQDALRPGLTVLLVAGNQHVRRDLGIPQHLDPGLRVRIIAAQALGAEALPAEQADQIWIGPAQPPRDHCAGLKQQLKR